MRETIAGARRGAATTVRADAFAVRFAPALVAAFAVACP
jgi:hypothetical protein